MSKEVTIAPADSLLGMLQRGRGDGYRRALKQHGGTTQALLFECITHDPRLDSQVESRAEYYASLALDIQLPLEPLAEYLRQHDDPSQFSRATSLTVDTLTELARRRHTQARDILLDYISWGQWWNGPAGTLATAAGEKFSSEIAQAVERHFPTNEALDEAIPFGSPIFSTLAVHSQRISASISRSFKKERISKSEPPDLSLHSLQELLSRANRKNFQDVGKALGERVSQTDTETLVSRVSPDNLFVSCAALTGLTKLAQPSLLPWLLELWMDLPKNGPMESGFRVGQRMFERGLLRAILALPGATTRPLARAWINEADSRKRDLAEDLLQAHATLEDIPLLRECLRPLLMNEDAEYSCMIIKAFYHLPNAGMIPELIDIYHQFRFSMGRSYAVKAIQISSPEYFSKNLALECLWDCEEQTREAAAKSVSVRSLATESPAQFGQ